MSLYNQQEEAPVSYPPPVTAYPPPSQSAPPPLGYPTMDASSQPSVPQETTSRGDGFWEGCCAAICCCCALDCCF